MKLNNAIMPKNTLRPTAAQAAPPDFATAILSKTLQNQISKSVPDEKSRARFTSAIIQVVSGSEELQKCSPASIISSALRGEGMKLMIGSQYYIVPYAGTAAFILGFKGMIQLAMSTKEYEALDCTDVRENEYLGRDPKTGQPLFRDVFGTDDEERENAPIIGYKAFFLLRSGFERIEYWSINKIINHAVKYSHIDKDKLTNAINGSYRPAKKESPWYDYPDGFQKMAMKTVMRALLNSGYAPLNAEVKYAIDSDTDLVIPDVPQERPIPLTSDPLIIDAPTQPVQQPKEEEPKKEAPPKQPKKQKPQESAVSDAQTASKPKGKEVSTDPLKVDTGVRKDPLSGNMNAPIDADDQIPGQASIFDGFVG